MPNTVSLKSIHMISSYTVSQLGHVFLRHSVDRREMLEHRQSQRLKRLTGGGHLNSTEAHNRPW